MKTIKILRNIFIKGEPHERGTIAQVDAVTASLLVGDCSAEYVPEKAEPDSKPEKAEKTKK